MIMMIMMITNGFDDYDVNVSQESMSARLTSAARESKGSKT